MGVTGGLLAADPGHQVATAGGELELRVLRARLRTSKANATEIVTSLAADRRVEPLSAAVGGGFFDLSNRILGSWFGQRVLFGYTWSLFHHALGGIRHFVWDFLQAMDPAGREMIVRLQLALSILLTIGAWALWVWR